MKGKSDGGETCAKCFELKMRIPIDYAFVLQRSQWPLRLLPP
jgi:predicted adenine nucleotide alpha hydrolase (AANH) superfamily ATPase